MYAMRTVELENAKAKISYLEGEINKRDYRIKKLEEEVAMGDDKCRQLEIDNLVQLNKLMSPRKDEPSLKIWREKQTECDNLQRKVIDLETELED